MDNRRMTDEQKTGEAAGGEAAGGEAAGGEAVDFRKDPAPTNWLEKRALKYAEHAGYPEADDKRPSDHLDEFIAELSKLRCEPVCANGQVAANTTASANGQLTAGCICSLVEQLANPDTNLVVPKDEFLAIVGAVGFSLESALEQYRNYYSEKQWDKYKSKVLQLSEESENACNWWLELDSDEAYSQSMAAENELEALERKMEQELEAIMSA